MSVPTATTLEHLRRLAQHALLEATFDGIALIDASGQVVFANPTLARMLGEDFVGRPATELVVPQASKALEAALAERLAGSVVHLEAALRRGRGAAVWARVVTSPLIDEVGAYAGALAVMTDITEHRWSERALRTIADMSRALGGELDMQGIASAVARSIDGGVVIGLLEGPGRVAIRAGATVVPRAEQALDGLLGRVLVVQSGTIGDEVIRRGEAVRIEANAASRLQPLLASLVRQVGIESVVVAPLLVHARCIGVMGVFRVAEAEPLAAEEVPLVREMADRAAMAIERARLFEEQRRSNERLGLLADAGTLMAQSLDVRAALVSFVRLAVTSFAHACVVLIFERGRVSSAVAAHDPGLEGATQRAVDRYASATKPPAEIRRVFEAGRAELVRPVDERLLQGLAVDDAQVELLRALALRSMIVVPLTARGVTIGVVAFGRTSDPAYDDDDLGFAQELGRRAALAIDNARLFRKATEAVALRDEFLSIASHELNTPLTPLKMQLDSLRRGNFPPERVAEKLDAASRQVTRLAKLVGELLDVSRIRIGKLHLEPEPLDLATLLDDAVARMRDEAERSGSRVVVTAERPCTGTWDRTRLDQVVTNLLTNAIKYGGGKPIEITLGCTATGARLVVRDHGIGISPENQARIFERFERAASARHYGGFGLGLWIARQIVEESGGKITVESTPGEGSTFVVELPR